MGEYELGLATQMGTERGLAAASWVFDGNTTTETYRRFLEMSDAGDPELYDTFGPVSGWLSGEYAEGPTPAELAHELGLETDTEAGWAEADEACNAYEEAAEEAYWRELERVARLQTS